MIGNTAKKIGSPIYNNPVHALQIAAWLPFWYHEGVGMYALTHIDHFAQSSQKYGFKKGSDPIVIELLKLIGKNDNEILTYKSDDELFPSPAAAFVDKAILISKVLESYPHEAKKFAVGHEIMHIINRDTQKRVIANICTPLLSYAILKGGKAITNKITDEILATATEEDLDKKLSYKILAGSRDFINIVSEYPLTHYVLSLYLLSKFSQYQEVQADIGAALMTGTIEGALSYFAHSENLPPLSLWLMLKKYPYHVITGLINGLLGYREHPSHGDRIKILIDLAKKNRLHGIK